MNEDYIRTARAKGLSLRTVHFRHALRNALLPLVTLIALDLPTVFGGAVFIETIFAWPGMGRLFWDAAKGRDYPILLAVMMIYAALTLHGDVQSSYLSTNIPSADNPDGGNYFRWANPEADGAIEAAGSTFDQTERRDAYCELAQLIQEDAVQNHIYLFQDGYGFSSRLEGYTVSTWGSRTWNVQNWKFKE